MMKSDSRNSFSGLLRFELRQCQPNDLFLNMRSSFLNLMVCISCAALMLYSCSKDGFTTDSDAQVSFSKDSIKFDTVFVSSGSVTQSFKIYNNNNQKIRISQILLMGGNTSPFQININGISSVSTTDFELDSQDSAYVFVTVNINPNQQNIPFQIQDSIRFDCNGKTKYVQLEAYGQNARFIRDLNISSNTTWNDSLPYVILGQLSVDSNAILRLLPGCRIYVGASAPIIINGTLVSEGTHSNPIIFRGNRLDEYYNNLPGSWPGIYFRASSKNNLLTYTRILNANDAINLINPSPQSPTPKLTLQQCIIDNALQSGIYALSSSFIATNCLISNCRKNISIEKGGVYELEHCTVVAYSNAFILHQNPVLEASDFAVSGTNETSDLNLLVKNSILWGEGGTNPNELRLNKIGNGLFSVRFNNCLLKLDVDPAELIATNIIRNIDPLFDNIDTYENRYNFRTSEDASAPGIDNGASTSVLIDLDGLPRVVNGTPDIGCYEKQ